MNRKFRYLILCCCTIVLILFLGQVDGYIVAQKNSQNSNNGVDALAFSPDSKTLASGTDDGQIILTDSQTGKEKGTLSPSSDSSITGVAFSSDGKTLISVGKDSLLKKWNLVTSKQSQILQGHEGSIRTVAVSSDNKWLATGAADTKVILWNSQTNKLDKVLEGHKCFVNSVAFSPKQNILASADDCGLSILWDLKTGKQIQSLIGHSDPVTAIAFSPDGTILASVSKDSTARLWDVAKGEQIKVLKGATKQLSTVAFTKNGKNLIAGGDEQEIFQWNVATGSLLGRLKGHNGVINKIAISSDGLNFASADKNGVVKIWDSANGLIKRSFSVPRKLGRNKSLKSQKDQDTTSSVKKATVTGMKKTVIAAVSPAPGGPILLITTTATNSFSNYYTEILRNEGLNAFDVSDISSVSTATLANYDVVILADMTLTPDQVTMFSDWVTAGGNLIATHPDKQLAGLLGLTDAGSTLANAYLLVDTSTDVGSGIVGQTIQFHGAADLYTLNGATSIASLYTNATTATSNPAVTLHTVGSNGGQAAAFTYDLARSIVYTRQGNPEWATQERDAYTPIRSGDLYYGNKSGDAQTDWVDLNKVAIPHADEQMRLLANLIIKMNFDKKPLPRFWYFPNGKKAVVLMSGDDHANGGTDDRFDQFKANSPSGCSVENWECIRGTSYIYPDSPLTSAQADAYNADGFEVALHVNTNCQDFTPASLESAYTQQLNNFTNKYSSIPAPSTQRHHCLVWSDWFSTPQVELNHNIRLDTTYYYWPSFWILDRPGLFTGSGMPMRLANTDGTMIDVYQSVTQMTDESGQSYPYTVDTLLDRAIGTEGYYGVFNVNAHTDAATSSVSDAVVKSAKDRGVPIVSAKQVLTWLDGRNTSSFGSLTWSNNTLNFTIAKGTGATGLQAMLPNRFDNLALISITLDGSSVTHTPQVIKGIEYAFFPGNAGSYVATYTSDTTPPTVSSNSPSNGATDVSTVTSVTATFSEPIDGTTINTNTFELRDQANALVAATVTYNVANSTATLTPSSSLALGTTYSATIKGGETDPRVKDRVGNALAANFTWSFTTAATSPSVSIWDNSTTPTNPSNNDAKSVELGVKFKSSVDGYITGIRFYKGNNDTDTYIGNLWNINGDKLATATIENESSLGWLQINFSNPVKIDANTVYVASYHTNIGRYPVDNNFFANSGVSKSPIYLLRDGENGANGVYNYGASSFPKDTYQSSNYWVDVVFRTSISAGITPSIFSLWNSTATPTVFADSDTNPVELGVKFQSDQSGSITGIRFYKNPSDTGTHIGSLWTNTGSLLATASFSNETPSGWQQVNFATPVSISANTTYVASYNTSAGRYPINIGYFATARNNPPLQALSNEAVAGNGLYKYGSSTPVFPNESFNSSNYWVDVVFTTN
jgi:WD40 repeat protein